MQAGVARDRRRRRAPASAPAGLSRCWQIFQLTLSQTWCRSASFAENTALVSRQTWTSPLPASISDEAGRVLPTKWLCFDRPCSRSICITSLRSAVRTCSSTPSSSLNRALSVSSSRRGADLRWPSSWRRRNRRGCR